VALVATAALLMLSNVYGQRNDASAVFEGRPVPAGAQSGTGALAGPPQGGIGVQGIDHSGVALRPPSGLRDMPQGTIDPAADSIALNRSVRNDKDLIPRDTSLAKEQRSAAKKTRKAAKTVHDQAKYGVATMQ